MNFLIAVPASIVAIIFYNVLGTSGTLTGPFDYDIIKILPYIVVLVAALVGMNVVSVLLLGTGICGIIGIATGSLTFITFMQSIASGIKGMAGLVILAIVLRGLTGIASEYGGVDWLVKKLSKNMNSRKSAEYGIATLVGLIDVSMANNTVAILVTAPIANTFAKLHNIAPKRVASIMDIFSCVIQGIIPHGGQMLLASTLAGISPFEILKYSYYPIFLAIFAIITIQFGLLKTKEEKAYEVSIENGVSSLD
jgi:Na+/H+ antiporter NhaC